MPRSKRGLERLVVELASLTAEERSRVVAEAARRAKWYWPPAGWTPPMLEPNFLNLVETPFGEMARVKTERRIQAVPVRSKQG
jgi:hypothetical protein